MGVCGSKRDLKLEEVTITEKPPAESHAAAENPAAETAPQLSDEAPANTAAEESESQTTLERSQSSQTRFERSQSWGLEDPSEPAESPPLRGSVCRL